MVDPNHPLVASLDHVRPQASGGITHVDNLRIAHRMCNSIRGSSDSLRNKDSSWRDLEAQTDWGRRRGEPDPPQGRYGVGDWTERE